MLKRKEARTSQRSLDKPTKIGGPSFEETVEDTQQCAPLRITVRARRICISLRRRDLDYVTYLHALTHNDSLRQRVTDATQDRRSSTERVSVNSTIAGNAVDLVEKDTAVLTKAVRFDEHLLNSPRIAATEPLKAMAGVGAATLGWLADKTSIETVHQVCALLPLLGVRAGKLPKLEQRPRRS